MAKLVNLLNALDGDFGGGVVAQAVLLHLERGQPECHVAAQFGGEAFVQHVVAALCGQRPKQEPFYTMDVGLAADCARLIARLIKCT